MWVASSITDAGIDIFWQQRVVIDGVDAVVFDYNGDIDRTVSAANIGGDESMVHAGTISVWENVERFCSDSDFLLFVEAVSRHAVDAVRLGYGDDIESLIMWMSNPGNMFVLCGDYESYECVGVFEGIMGAKVTISIDDGIVASGSMGVYDFTFDIDAENVFDFLSSFRLCE